MGDVNASDGVGDTTATVITTLKDYAAHPFSTEMSLSRWALFTGVIVAMTILWIMVLHDLRGEI